jgi:hypothetical protein
MRTWMVQNLARLHHNPMNSETQHQHREEITMAISKTERINLLEQRLTTVQHDEDRRRHIEERLTDLRLTVPERIQVFQHRLVQTTDDVRLRIRLEQLQQRHAAQVLRRQQIRTNDMEGLEIVNVDAATRQKLTGRQENLQAGLEMSLDERIEKVKAKLAVTNLSNRDALEARLAMIETKKALGDRPKALPSRVKWMEARLEQNPDQPKLQARLERLQTKLGVDPAAVDGANAVPAASSSSPDHRLIHLDARIRLIEQRLVDPKCQNQHNASLVTKLRHLHSTKDKLLFGKWRCDRKISKTDPTEDRAASSLDRRMDYLRHNRGHHETAAEVAAFTTSTEKVIVEQVRDMKLA